MKRKIIKTKDGSRTILIEDWNESYHSKHGAIKEAMHVFIEHGLCYFLNRKTKIRILEIGYGTGLNCFLTFLFAKKNGLSIEYMGVDKYPISMEEFFSVHYLEDCIKELGIKNKEFSLVYDQLFDSEWNKWNDITSEFKLKKLNIDFFDLNQQDENHFDLIYFDAFGSRVQPELWEKDLLKIVTNLSAKQAVFSTYAAKGSLKRILNALGFDVKKKLGPPGKREIMIGFKGMEERK